MLATADYVFCDTDALVDIANGGGQLVAAFDQFIKGRVRLVEDVVEEVERQIREKRGPWNQLRRMLDDWNMASGSASVVKLSIPERAEVSRILKRSTPIEPTERVKDLGETATVVRSSRWLREEAPRVTVVAMTDAGGHRLAAPRKLPCFKFDALLSDLLVAELIDRKLHDFAHAKKYGRVATTS